MPAMCLHFAGSAISFHSSLASERNSAWDGRMVGSYMQPAGDDPWWTTSVVVGPNTERDERVANRQRYGAIAATLGDARRLYFQRALELVEEFDRSFETCVRDADPTTRVETILDEVAQKCSHGLDQAWFALWQTSIAPRARSNAKKRKRMYIFR
jgi:hypothetical protein